MRYAKTALMLLRVGIGLYLIFTAATRLMGYQTAGTFDSIYALLGAGLPVNQSVFALGASVFLGLLGLLLLSGKVLVVGGMLVALVGLFSGLSELITSQWGGLTMAEQFTRMSNGVRDVLVLGSTGGAIAALDAYLRHRVYRDTHARRGDRRVTMYREDVPVGTGTPTTPTSTVTRRRD